MRITVERVAPDDFLQERLGGSGVINRRAGERGVMVSRAGQQFFLAERVLDAIGRVFGGKVDFVVVDELQEEDRCGAGHAASKSSTARGIRESKKSGSQKSAAGGGSQGRGRRSTPAAT
jgi:hypothetical protein